MKIENYQGVPLHIQQFRNEFSSFSNEFEPR